jgi:hypothetical protein
VGLFFVCFVVSSVHLLLPAALNLDLHLLLHPPHAVANFKRDELVRLLSLIAELPARNRKLARRVRERGGFVPISSRWAQRAVRGYNHYFAYAVDSGLLETDGLCWPGAGTRRGKCTGYRYPAAYTEQAGPGLAGGGRPAPVGPPRMQLVALEDEQVIRAVRRQRQRRRITLAERKRYHAHRHVLQWLDENQTPFRIDAEAALVAVAHERARLEADPSLRQRKGPGWKRRWGRHQDTEHFVSPNEQHTQRVNTIVRLADRALGPVLDEVGGRLHSSLTNMSSLLRPFVYAEGHGQLVSLDLANSQPYLLNLLVNPAFYREEFRSPNFRRGGLRWEKEGKGIRREVREGYRKAGGGC